MRPLRFTLLVASALLAGYSSVTAAREREGETIEAIRRVQVLDFYFRGTTGRYRSCSTLRSKIRGALEEMGGSNVVVSIGCDRHELVERTRARIATAMPVPATPENIRAATTFDTEHAMVAHLRQITLPTADTIARFPAEWREVAIETLDGSRVGADDCDLLRDLHDQILPQLPSVRVVRKRFTCETSHLTRPLLVVQALIPHGR